MAIWSLTAKRRLMNSGALGSNGARLCGPAHYPARVGAQKIWVGTVRIDPRAKIGAAPRVHLPELAGPIPLSFSSRSVLFHPCSPAQRGQPEQPWDHQESR